MLRTPDAAVQTLARFGMNAVQSLPAIVQTIVKTPREAFEVAAFLNDTCRRQVDTLVPVRRAVDESPMGSDVALAAAIQTAVGTQAPDWADLPLSVVFLALKDKLVCSRGLWFPLDSSQLLLPYLLRTDLMLNRDDATDVSKHAVADDESTATKLAQSFGRQTAHEFDVKWNGREAELDMLAFFERLSALAAAAPSVTYRALGKHPAISAAWPSAVQAYAEHVQCVFENEA